MLFLNDIESFAKNKKRLELKDIEIIIKEKASVFEKEIINKVEGSYNNFIIISEENCIYVIKDTKIYFWIY